MSDLIVRTPVLFWGIPSKKTGLTYEKEVAEAALKALDKGLLAGFCSPLNLKYVVGWADNPEIVGHSLRCDVTLTDNAPDEVKESWDLKNLGFTLVMDIDRSYITQERVSRQAIREYSHIFIYPLKDPNSKLIL